MRIASKACALLALLAVSHAAADAKERSLLWAGDPGFPGITNVADDPSGKVSGLNLVSGTLSGRTLSDSLATDVTSLAVNYADPTHSWTDTFAMVHATASTTRRRSNGIAMSSEAADTLMQNYLWLPDTQGAVVYKINTATQAIAGAYYTHPSLTAGNPATVAVTSAGDAWIGNAFTFNSSETGSLTKIQLDEATACGGTTSAGSTALSWGGSTLAGATDACTKVWSDLGAPGGTPDATAYKYAIAAIVADGADNIFTIAIDESVRFDGKLNIYQTTPAGVTTKVLADYQDPNAITNPDNLAADNDGPGAIGGSGAVIDRWGYLWMGAGTYIKGAGTGSATHLVVRMDTQNPGTIEYYAVPHETQALALDNESRLWVAGGDSASLLYIDPGTIGAGIAPDTLHTDNPPIVTTNLVTGQGNVCAGDTCCIEGNYNTGIVVTRSTGDVYIANECPTGVVAHLAPGTAGTFLEAISTGSYPSAIQTAADNTVWVPSVALTGTNLSVSTSTIYQFAETGGAATAIITASGTPYLGGNGDMTGRSTAQPPDTATWTWVHDTTISGYAKWAASSAGYTTFNSTVGDGGAVTPGFTMTVQTSDIGATGPWSAPTTLTGNVGLQVISPDAGRWSLFKASFARTAKIAPEIGPQAYGLFSFLTQVKFIPLDNPPVALCDETVAVADAPTDQSDTTYSTSSSGRYCGAPLSSSTAINAGSHDPDTAELDDIVPIQPTSTFYNPAQYYMQSSGSRFTVSTLTVTDINAGVENTCAANVNIRDTTPPVWSDAYTVGNVSTSRSIDDVPTLCVWPPNFQYFCWLDVMNNTNNQILPLYDNCAGGVPIGKQVVGTTCVDSDPRTEAGDCVLYQDGSNYNLCVLGWRRTVYTNTARVYQVNIPVTDASSLQTDPTTGAPTGDPDVATVFSRRIQVPPLWNFQTAGDCPRPTYVEPAGISQVISNVARK